MGRQDLQHIMLACTGGINQSAERADFNQCATALNVWAPGGRVESRPGYRGVSQSPRLASGSANLVGRTQADRSVETYVSPSGAGVLTLSGLVARSGATGGIWYIGHSATFSIVELTAVAPNANASTFKAEYWNGAVWEHLPSMEEQHGETLAPYTAAYTGASHHLENDAADAMHLFSFVTPADWATTTVDTQSAYWLRFHVLTADIDAACSVDIVPAAIDQADVTHSLVGLFAPQFPTAKRYVFLERDSVFVTALFQLANSKIAYRDAIQISRTASIGPSEPAGIAVVPQFEEAFIAYDNIISRTTASPTSSDSLDHTTVETADFAVGATAPYDPNYIAQLSEFPRAKYIQFFKGHLWVANLKDEPFTVRWSAAQPYHKVWPQLTFEVLAEHDNSPITGMHPLGEYMAIFKEDSIWMAYDSGLDAFGLQTYAIRQVVDGVGCVANSSIKAVRGNLIFLAEDGLYRFDGASVSRVSNDPKTGQDRLKDFWPTITAGRRPFAAAAHWSTKNCYLLSVTTNGLNANNKTLCWDYDDDTFWLWDNIDAQHWLEDEAADDNQILYFGDSNGRIFQFGVGHTDNGAAISSSLTTQRLGYTDVLANRLRSAYAMCSNQTRTITIEAIANDEMTGTTATLPFTDTNEDDWTAFNYATGASTDDNYTPGRRRLKRVDFRKDYDFLQLKVSHSTKYQPFEMGYLDVGLLPLARSR